MMKNNTNPNLNSNTTSNNIINNAFMMIKNELKKKDDRISQLEFQLSELQKKYNSLTNNNGNNINQIQIPNTLNKNFTFGEKNSEEIKQTKPQSPPSINRGKFGINFQKFSQNNSSHNVNYNSDNEYLDNKRFNQKNFGLGNDSGNENSVLTFNSNNFRIYSKGEVKMFLKEVKSRVDPPIFKDFIQNIKLLTSTKDKNGIDKNIIVENVKILFGEEFKDLFVKFESIIGLNNN